MESKNVFDSIVETLTADAFDLQEKLSNANKAGDYRKSLDTMRILKDTLYLIDEYGGKSKNRNVETDNMWINLLKPFIENEQSMLFLLNYKDRDLEKKHRCTGKTTAIKELAMQYDLPIFTGSHVAKDYNRTLTLPQYKHIKNKAYSTWNSFRGQSYSNIVLVDEGFQDISLEESLIEDYGLILIGFKMNI